MSEPTANTLRRTRSGHAKYRRSRKACTYDITWLGNFLPIPTTSWYDNQSLKGTGKGTGTVIPDRSASWDGNNFLALLCLSSHREDWRKPTRHAHQDIIDNGRCWRIRSVVARRVRQKLAETAPRGPGQDGMTSATMNVEMMERRMNAVSPDWLRYQLSYPAPRNQHHKFGVRVRLLKTKETECALRR